jgi:1-deoxy-D-xylulose-5-phosphate synthase
MTADWKKPFEKLEIGRGRQLSEGKDVAILTIGKAGIMTTRALEIIAGKNISAAHYDMRFVKPLDEGLLKLVFQKFSKIITVEDGVIRGGFGSAVLEFMAENGFSAKVKVLGIPDKFIEHGSQDDLYKECGIDVGGICKAVLEIMER